MTNFFDDSVNISAEDGFNFAVALVYKSDISLILDSSYFSFELQVQNWYDNEQGERYQETIPAGLRRCTAEEIGVNGSDSKFFPLGSDQANIFETRL